MPKIFKSLLKFSCTNIIVSLKLFNPSTAKNSLCIGIKTLLDATKAFKVNNPRDGGQSISIKS